LAYARDASFLHNASSAAARATLSERHPVAKERLGELASLLYAHPDVAVREKNGKSSGICE
jgi:hypothetical protein